MTWQPTTPEDRLLANYHAANSGILFLEVPVGHSAGPAGARRIDGVLVPGDSSEVRPQGSYTTEAFGNAVRGREIHLIEAKQVLNRTVIGQVLVGSGLIRRDFKPAKVIQVAVCGSGHADLEWYCGDQDVRVEIFPIRPPQVPPGQSSFEQPGRTDVRAAPGASRRRAFLAGWAAALGGRLYDSVRTRKTHMGMGNLFGWIYGEQPDEFKLETWERYIRHSRWSSSED